MMDWIVVIMTFYDLFALAKHRWSKAAVINFAPDDFICVPK
jgi:hypothetical protein